MIYAELIKECRIAERGIFMSIGEFLPYRRRGWSGTRATDEAADIMIAAEERGRHEADN